MYQQLRGPERLFKIGQWFVAILFAYFLIKVGASIIADLPSVNRPPALEDFLNKPAIHQTQDKINQITQKIDALEKQSNAWNEKLIVAQEDYSKENQSFQNWRSTRSSTDQSDQNPEVISRAKKLDQLLQKQKEIEVQLSRLRENINALNEVNAPDQEKIRLLNEEAHNEYYAVERQHALKSFFIRLLFVLPLLIGAIWMFRRHRHSQHWPFAWGFIFFALFAFFFELVPYLPSFGGYIRFGVGAVLTFLGGRYLMIALQNYLERKRQEQAAPQEERKQDIVYEKALESLSRCQCPSCERKIPSLEGNSVSFCMHCGLRVMKVCDHCGLRHNAFYPFCPSCGNRDQTKDSKMASLGKEPSASTPTKVENPSTTKPTTEPPNLAT
jgi:predicted RNA-binding Zn-ribbon protein involved in translation (DUF1610 family)/outer membrane murein-binding lipoprotein Lpp